MGDFDNSNMNSRNLIKLRGLPWDATPADILDFLKDVEVVNNEKGIYMAFSPRDGRPNGEAFLELATPNDVDKAFTYNKNMIGRRYIEIFNAKQEEFDQCLRRQNVIQQDTFIKLRGLPFSCRLDDIEQFFSGLEIRNGKTGIYIVYDSHGRMTGECFVQFKSTEHAENALKRNREKIGHRYIEIFRSSASECRRSTMYTRNMNNSNFGNNNGGGNNGGNDRMSNRPGPGPRNQRNNFRDRPYPDQQGGPWSSSNDNHPWRNNSNNNMNRNNYGGGNNGSNDSFGSNSFGNNNFGSNNSSSSLFNNDNNFNDFNDRNWKSGGGNNNSDRGGFGNGNSNNLFNDNFNDFNDRGWKSNNNNSNNDRGFFNNGGIGGGGGNNSNMNMNNCGGGNNSGGPYLVHLRGMPYDCNEMEVHQFFAPLKLVNCVVLYNNDRHTGEADAYFATVEDAQEAMKKHKEKMGSRYIELFANRNSERRGRF